MLYQRNFQTLYTGWMNVDSVAWPDVGLAMLFKCWITLQCTHHQIESIVKVTFSVQLLLHFHLNMACLMLLYFQDVFVYRTFVKFIIKNNLSNVSIYEEGKKQ